MNKEINRTIIDMSQFGDKSTQANLAYLDNVYSRIREWVKSGGASSGKPAAVIVIFGETTENGIKGSLYTSGRNDIAMDLLDETLFDMASDSPNGDKLLVTHCYNTLCKLKNDDVATNFARACLLRRLNVHEKQGAIEIDDTEGEL